MRSRRAFTLVEVIVTALVAIALTAMAVPQFSGAGAAGTDGAAQVSLEAASSAEVTNFTQAQVFTANAPTLSAIDNSVNYVSGSTPATSTTTISVAVSSDGTTVGLAAVGANSVCWLLRRSLSPASSDDAPVLYGSAPIGLTYTCTGSLALTMNANTTLFISSGTGLSWANPLTLS